LNGARTAPGWLSAQVQLPSDRQTRGLRAPNGHDHARASDARTTGGPGRSAASRVIRPCRYPGYLAPSGRGTSRATRPDPSSTATSVAFAWPPPHARAPPKLPSPSTAPVRLFEGEEAVLHVMGEQIASKKRRNPWTSRGSLTPTSERRRPHITVGAAPSGQASLEKEIRLVKPALLYADHPTLHRP
jgi:hypothetical protein